MTAEELKQILINRLQAALVEVIDDSAKHRGHAGVRQSGGGHYQALVVSDVFDGLTRVARHQKVYSVLRDEMSSNIHALSLQLFTPAEWKQNGGVS